MTGEVDRYRTREEQTPDAAAVVAIRTPKLRKSCDFCCERKRRCDGQRPCRVRLSASPATGLVGLKENGFLGTFFNCLGFLPLACESTVRQGLVKTMLGMHRGQTGRAAAPSTGYEVGEGSNKTDAICRHGQNASGKSRLVSVTDCSTSEGQPNIGNNDQEGVGTASVCELWCAIAIGALVQGQPPEQVASYKHLAWIALSGCFDQVTPETARAYAVMAYLHNFLGDQKMFYRYLKMAKGMVDVLPPEKAQAEQDIEQVLMKLADKRLSHSLTLKRRELLILCEDFCADEVPVLKIPPVFRKDTLCSLLIQADVKLYQAFLRDWKRSAGAGEDRQTMDEDGDSHDDTVTIIEGSCPDMEGGGSDYPLKVDASVDNDSKGDKGPCRPPPAPRVNTEACIHECLELLKRMKDATEMPEVAGGAGGLLTKGFQCFMEMRYGDKRAGAQKLVECANIMIAFPGLIRFSRWHHISHCVLGLLAAVDNAELYERLRQAYNKVLIGDIREVPPREEWRVSSVCDHLFCRVSDERLQAHMKSTKSSTKQAQDKSVILARSSREGSGPQQVEERQKQQQKHKQNIRHCQEQQMWKLQQQQHVEMGRLQEQKKVFPQEMLLQEAYPGERYMASTPFKCEAQHHGADIFPDASNQTVLRVAAETPRGNRKPEPAHPETLVRSESAVDNGSCALGVKDLRDTGHDSQVGMLLGDPGAPPLRLVSVAVDNGSCALDVKDLRDTGHDSQVGMLLGDPGAPPLRLVSVDSIKDLHHNGASSDKYYNESGRGKAAV